MFRQPMGKDKKPDKKIVIEGVTNAGEQFRPSDWAERMTGNMATVRNHRVVYSPLLQPSLNKAGYHCVLLDPALKESNPELYQSILDFAKSNNLRICDESDTNGNNDGTS